MYTRDRRGLALARAESKKSNVWPAVGAVIIKGTHIIGRGYNQFKTHPKYNDDPEYTIHAEADAINSLRTSDLRRARIYVYRETADGNPALAKPCLDCQEIIDEIGIERIVHSV